MSEANAEWQARWDEAWLALEEGVKRARHPFHQMVIANIDETGLPQLRSVILRHAEIETRLLAFHTDIRSPKARAIAQNPSVSCLFYDVETKWQLRLGGRATIHHQNAWSERQWRKTREQSKLCYLAQVASGDSVRDSSQCGVSGKGVRALTSEQNATAYEHFSVVTIQVEWMDCLWLYAAGHQRCRLIAAEPGRISGQWVAI